MAIAGVALCLTLSVGCSAETKTLRFSGYDWVVKSGDNQGPGPNRWDAANAWLDPEGRLHLKLTERGGQWYCAQIGMTKRLGFGRYQFWVTGRIDQLDPNVVFGLFTYPPHDVGPDGTHEIDIEFARWGNPAAPIGNYTVWPAKPGVDRSFKRFALHLEGEATTQRFAWSAKSVSYQSLGGHRDDNENALAEWQFAPPDPASQIGREPLPVEINLWLFKGRPPSDGREVEVIVRAFAFTPMP
jgi:hypothetical protein